MTDSKQHDYLFTFFFFNKLIQSVSRLGWGKGRQRSVNWKKPS